MYRSSTELLTTISLFCRSFYLPSIASSRITVAREKDATKEINEVDEYRNSDILTQISGKQCVFRDIQEMLPLSWRWWDLLAIIFPFWQSVLASHSSWWFQLFPHYHWDSLVVVRAGLFSVLAGGCHGVWHLLQCWTPSNLVYIIYLSGFFGGVVCILFYDNTCISAWPLADLFSAS